MMLRMTLPNGCETIAPAFFTSLTSPLRNPIARGSSSTNRVSMQVRITSFLSGNRSVRKASYSLRSFIERKEYEAFRTDRFPDKKLVILTCMDTRLVELLPRAMGFRNGDVKLVKNAGAIVSHPFGSVMRSIMVAIYELNAEEVIVVGHSE